MYVNEPIVQASSVSCRTEAIGMWEIVWELDNKIDILFGKENQSIGIWGKTYVPNHQNDVVKGSVCLYINVNYRFRQNCWRIDGFKKI